MDCVKSLEPEKMISGKDKDFDWITDKMKICLTKRNNLFPEWVDDPADTISQTHKRSQKSMPHDQENQKRS